MSLPVYNVLVPNFISPEVHNLLVVVLSCVLMLWAAKLCKEAVELSELAFGLRKRRLLRIDGILSDEPNADMYTAKQLDKLAQRQHKVASVTVDRLECAVHLRAESVKLQAPPQGADAADEVDECAVVTFVIDARAPADLDAYCNVPLEKLEAALSAKSDTAAATAESPKVKRRRFGFGDRSRAHERLSSSSSADGLPADPATMRQEVLAEAAWHKHMAVPMGDDRRLTLSIPRSHLTALDKTTLICPLMLVLAPASAAASPSTLYTFVEFVGFDEENSSRARAAVVITQALATRDGLIELQEVYGSLEEEEECVVCLSEPKHATILPCRHLCACRECFEQLDRCPVCRGPIEASLQFQDGDDGGGGGGEQGRLEKEAQAADADSVYSYNIQM